MHMIYNSDSYAVVLFEAPAAIAPGADSGLASARPQAGGYELVDKFAGKETFISGTLAESFKSGVEALIQTRPSEDEMDDYIEGYAALMQQPLTLH